MSGPAGRRWQFSLLTLLIAMGIVAVLCLALRSPNELWATAVFAAALFSLALAVLAAIYRSGRTRAFALGFLVLGAGYWGLVLLTEQGEAYGQPRLPTTRWAILLFTLLHQENVQTATVMTPVYSAPTYTTGMPPPTPVTTYSAVVQPSGTFAYFPQTIQRPQFVMQTFLDITQQSLALLLGILGGILAQWLYATRHDDPAHSTHLASRDAAA